MGSIDHPESGGLEGGGGGREVRETSLIIE